MKNSILKLELEITSIKKDIDIERFFIQDLKDFNSYYEQEFLHNATYVESVILMGKMRLNNGVIKMSEQKIFRWEAKIISLQNMIIQKKNLH